MCYLSLLLQDQQQLCSINNNTVHLWPIASVFVRLSSKTPALPPALLTQKTAPSGLRMRMTSSLLLASMLLLLLPSTEMKRPGKGKGLKRARHKLTRDRYGFTLGSNLFNQFFTYSKDCGKLRMNFLCVWKRSGWEVWGVTADQAPPGLWHLTAQSWQNLEKSLWTVRTDASPPFPPHRPGPNNPSTSF